MSLVTLSPVAPPAGLAPGRIDFSPAAMDPGPDFVRLANWTPNALVVDILGDRYYLDPWMVDVFCAHCRPAITYTQLAVTGAAALPAGATSTILVTVAKDEPIPGIYPVPLAAATFSLDTAASDVLPLSHSAGVGAAGLAADARHRHPFLDFLDVTWPEYGADPSGAADSQPAIAAAIAAATSSAIVADKVRIPAGTYKLSGPITLPVAGTTGLIIQGSGSRNTTLKTTGNTPAIQVTAGFHYDLVIRGLSFDASSQTTAYPFTITTPNQVVRLLMEEICFVSGGAGAIRLGGSVIGLTCRGILFNSVSGLNVSHDGTSQVNNVHFEDCWFQSGTMTKYLSFPTTTGGVVDSIKFERCLFEGPSNANTTTAAITLGGMTEVVFDHCEFADWQDNLRNIKLIQTMGAANGAPLYLTAIGCDFVNGEDSVFVIADSGAVGFPAQQWTFIGCQLQSKAGRPPFVVSALGNVQNLIFVGTKLTDDQGWATYPGNATLINCLQAGVYINHYSNGTGQYLGGVGLDSVDHNHSHNHGAHLHAFTGTHLHRTVFSHTHDLNNHAHAQVYGGGTTGAASAGTAHTHPYNDPNIAGAFGPNTGNPSNNNSGNTVLDVATDLRSPGNSDNATPTTDATVESTKHTHKG